MKPSIRPAAIALTCAFGAILPALGQEASIIDNSTVIGQNFSYWLGNEDADPASVGQVDLAVETAVFFKNLELIDLGALDGETFFGAIVPVRLQYRPSSALTIEAGLVLGQNFGDEDTLDDVNALIRIGYTPAENVNIIAGTLLQTHAMHQALLDDAQKFRDLTEQGLQVRVDGDIWKQDSWINWRIREGSVDAEEFEIGNVSQLRLFEDTVRLDAQVMWSHAGGQISTNRQVDNNLNAVIGASVGVHEPMGLELISDLRVGVAGLYSSDDGKDRPKTDASGFEVSGLVDFKVSDSLLVRGSASAYQGDPLIGYVGDPLYGFEEYYQVGATGLWSLNDDLTLEVGGVAQQNDGTTNWSALINLTWSGQFDLGFVRPR